MNTPIPPDFPITYCEPRAAAGIPPVYTMGSGTAHRGGKLWHEPIAGLIYNAVKKINAPEIKPANENKKKKSHKQILRERADALFS